MSRLACRLDRSNEPYPFGAILRTIARVVVHNGKGLKGGGALSLSFSAFPGALDTLGVNWSPKSRARYYRGFYVYECA